MRIRIITFLILPFFISACTTEMNQTTLDIEHQREIRKINDYITDNPFPFEKEHSFPTHGIRMFWTEVSGSGKKPIFGDTLVIDYVARRFDMPNRILDTSIQSVAEMSPGFSNRDIFVPVNYIIGSSFGKLASGFEIVFPMIEEGDKVTVFFPSRYGNRNPQNTRIFLEIPLIFELELHEIRSPNN